MRILCALVAGAMALTALGDDKPDVDSPAYYIAVTTASKLTYSVVDHPAKEPLAELTCGPRDPLMRVVKKADNVVLEPWNVKPDARKLVVEAEPLFEAKRYDE